MSASPSGSSPPLGARAKGCPVSSAMSTLSTRDKSIRTAILSTVKGHQEVPGGGHKRGPLGAIGSAQGWPPDVPGWLAQRDHSLSGDGLGEADAVAAGLADVGVVHEPVDGGGGQGFWHE